MEAVPALDALEDEEIRAARGELDVGRADDRPAIEVRRDLGVVRFRHRGDLLRLQDAADPAEVHLQDRGGAGFEHRANSYFVVSRSPVAIGIRHCAATFAISSGASGGVGSSNHKGS